MQKGISLHQFKNLKLRSSLASHRRSIVKIKFFGEFLTTPKLGFLRKQRSLYKFHKLRYSILIKLQKMKFLAIVAGITTLALCKDSVKVEKESTLGQFKQKAKQLYRQVDSNRDGKVTLQQLTNGVKRGLGFGEDDEEKSSPSYTQQLYEKYVRGDNKKNDWFTEQDFEEIFTSRHKSSNKRASRDDDNDESTYQMVKRKAGEIYQGFDKNKDGHVTLDELTSGLKEGLGFGDEDSKQKDQKSLTDQAKQLYDKYVGSDKKQNKWFTSQDFEDIVSKSQKSKRKSEKCKKEKDCDQDQSTLQLLKGKAGQIYDRFDTNKDGHVSLDELTGGLKKGLGFSDDEDQQKDSKKQKKSEESLTQYATELYEKYVKSDKKDSKSFSKEDFLDILHQKKKQSYLEMAKQKASQIYTSIDKNGNGQISLQEITNALKSGLGFESQDNDSQKSITERANQLYQKYVKSDKKDSKGFTLDDITAIVMGNMKKAKKRISKSASQAKQSISETIDDASQKKDEIVKKASKKLDDAKKVASEKASDARDSIQQNLEAAKDTISQKASDLKQSTEKAAKKIKDAVSEKASDLKQSAEQMWENSSQNLQKLKKKASQIYSGIDKDGDDSISLDELKSAIKNGLGFQSDDDDDQDEKDAKKKKRSQQDQKSLYQRATEYYNKLTNSDQKDKKFSKQDFFQFFSAQRKSQKQKSFLQKTKKQASDLYKKFDSNKDGHVSLDQITAGIKSGLGFDSDDQDSQPQDENSIKGYITELYEKYVKSDEKDKSGFTESDFADIIKNKRICKKRSKLSLQGLKNRAYDIHRQFDQNKDGHVSLQEATEGIKSRLGFGDDNENDQKSLLHYAKVLFDRFMKEDKKKALKLTKQDFSDIIYQWRDQCAAKKHNKPELEEL